MCALPPQTTETLSRAFCSSGLSPFTEDQLVKAALETRDYTLGDHDERALKQMLLDINYQAETEYGELPLDAIVFAPEEYTLTSEAVSHLDDVYNVLVPAGYLLAVIAIGTIVGLVATGIRNGKRSLGIVLTCAGAVVIVAFAACAIWAIVDFAGFFSAFHSLFFADGTWTFSYDSLLICMYPTVFWMGMGAIWLATTLVLSILAIVIGSKLRTRV